MSDDPPFPTGPASQQLRWYLERIASNDEGVSAADAEHFVSATRWIPAAKDPQGWARLRREVGHPEIVSIEEATDLTASVVMEGAGKRWRVICELEEQNLHRIHKLAWLRLYDVDVTARPATEADAGALSDIERRCPIVVGERSVAFDRGDDYFAFARLMEDVTVGLVFADGVPAAINCGAMHTVRVAGAERRVMTAIHTRVLPEHQRKGLWGAASQVLNEKYPRDSMDGSQGFVAVENTAMQKGFANVPNKWATQAVRLQLDCASLAGPPAGRPATADDAEYIIEVLNLFHHAEELYLPYTVDSLTARLERAPRQYSWERVWIGEGAVVGVWPAGESIRVIIEENGRRTESRRGLALDYGCLSGEEDELERLLHAWCGWLAERDFDTLSVFTSKRSPGYDRLRGLARDAEAFDMWTPGLDPPRGNGERGLYVDQVYF